MKDLVNLYILLFRGNFKLAFPTYISIYVCSYSTPWRTSCSTTQYVWEPVGEMMTVVCEQTVTVVFFSVVVGTPLDTIDA